MRLETRESTSRSCGNRLYTCMTAKTTKVRGLNERKYLVVEDAGGLRHHHLPQHVSAVNTVH